jgi:hypothetical protein
MVSEPQAHRAKTTSPPLLHHCVTFNSGPKGLETRTSAPLPLLRYFKHDSHKEPSILWTFQCPCLAAREQDAPSQSFFCPASQSSTPVPNKTRSDELPCSGWVTEGVPCETHASPTEALVSHVAFLQIVGCSGLCTACPVFEPQFLCPCTPHEYLWSRSKASTPAPHSQDSSTRPL